MCKILKAEFYKLWKMKSFWGLILFSCILSWVLMLDGSLPSDTLDFLSQILYTAPLLYFLVMIFGTLFIGSDFENRTIQSYISAGQKRRHILLAKVTVHLAGCISILYLPLFACTVSGCILFGITGITALVTKSLLSIWIICIMGMLPFLCAFIFKDVGKTLTVQLILYFIMLFLLNSRHYQLMALLLPMGQLRLLSLNQLSDVYAIVTDLLWIFICCFWACWDFSHSDLK